MTQLKAQPLRLRPVGSSAPQAAQRVRDRPVIVAFATEGSGTNDETRLRTLLKHFSPIFLPFNRGARGKTFLNLVRQIRRHRPNLVVVEGTGVAGGGAVLFTRIVYGIPYVVCSGDAAAELLKARWPFAGPLFAAYERLLCKLSAGYVGWSPYLVGRFLTLGAKRAMSVPGWSLFNASDITLQRRQEMRTRLGIPQDSLVVGLIGSLIWNPRVRYCYGCDLIQAARRIEREDIKVLIVGDGTGLPRLRQLAGDELGKRIFLTGRVRRDALPQYLAAMDLSSLPQSVDAVGGSRYTTKLSEYVSARLPVISTQVPVAYDLGSQWTWRLPGESPWDPIYIEALSRLLRTVTREDIANKRSAMPDFMREFDRDQQVASMTAFIRELLPAH